MTEIEAIRERHSVRAYLDKKIEPEKVQLLKNKIEQLNQEGNLHFQFIEEAGNTYSRMINKAANLQSAPSVVACMGENSEDLDERIGYYGEQLVLYAQQIGLNTCWAGIFSRKNIPIHPKEGERLVLTIAVGYGKNSGKERKSKAAAQVSEGDSDAPYWFRYGVEMALLAPTAMNQQKFAIKYENGSVSFREKGGPFSKVDLGIVKYHFEVGAACARETESADSEKN